MQLTIQGQTCDFIPIKNFRVIYGFSENFGIALFEPKDFTGLATIDHAGGHLRDLHAALLNNIPAAIDLSAIMPLTDRLRAEFRAGLYGINSEINLKPEEVEFAVAGFGDVMQALVYAVIPAIQTGNTPDFDVIYQHWLNNSIRISATIHDYQHEDTVWQVQIINHAYGRMGLQIKTETEVIYVADGVYVCPAQGYMHGLLRDLAKKIIAATLL
ncbi:MAG: hypothetical protein ACPG7F_10105 [Aggregatilineales bacterium]